MDETETKPKLPFDSSPLGLPLDLSVLRPPQDLVDILRFVRPSSCLQSHAQLQKHHGSQRTVDGAFL